MVAALRNQVQEVSKASDLASVRADAIREVLERQVAALSAMSERASEQAQQIDGALGARAEQIRGIWPMGPAMPTVRPSRRRVA